MSNTNINIIFDVVANTSEFTAAIRAAQAQVKILNDQVSAVGKQNAAPALAQMRRQMISNLTASGQFHSQVVNLDNATHAWSKRLEQQKLSLGESMKAMREYRREQGMLTKAARENVRMHQSIGLSTGTGSGGRRSIEMISPAMADMRQAGAMADMAKQKFSAMTAAMNNFSTQMINLGKNTQWTGRQISVGLTMPIMLLGTASAVQFKKVDEELTRISKVYGDSLKIQADPAKVKKEALDNAKMIATEYGVALEESLALTADIAATGITGSRLYDAVNQTTRLAILGEVDKQQAMKATLSMQSAFKLQTKKEMGDAVNYLNAVENATSASLSDLTEAIPRAGTVVKALGGDIKDLSLYMVAMREGGVAAGEAANALKSGLSSMITPSKEANNYVAELGINLDDIVKRNKGDLTQILLDFQKQWKQLDATDQQRAISKLFGKYQSARMTALFENLGAQGSQTREVLRLMGADSKELASAADRELKKSQESISGKFKRAWATLQASMVDVGQTFLKLATTLLEVVNKLMNAFNSAPDWLKNLLGGGIMAAAATGPLIMITGIIMNFVGNIGKMLTGLRAGYGKLFKNTGGFKAENESTAAAAIEAEKKLTNAMTAGAAEAKSAMNAVKMSVEQLQVALQNLRTTSVGTGMGTTSISQAFSGFQRGNINASSDFVFTMDTQKYNQQVLGDNNPMPFYKDAALTSDQSRNALAQRMALTELLYTMAGASDAPQTKKDILANTAGRGTGGNLAFSHAGKGYSISLGADFADSIGNILSQKNTALNDAMFRALQQHVDSTLSSGVGGKSVSQAFQEASTKYTSAIDDFVGAVNTPGATPADIARAHQKFEKEINKLSKMAATSTVNLAAQGGSVKQNRQIAMMMHLAMAGSNSAMLSGNSAGAVYDMTSDPMLQQLMTAQAGHFSPRTYAEAIVQHAGMAGSFDPQSQAEMAVSDAKREFDMEKQKFVKDIHLANQMIKDSGDHLRHLKAMRGFGAKVDQAEMAQAQADYDAAVQMRDEMQKSLNDRRKAWGDAQRTLDQVNKDQISHDQQMADEEKRLAAEQDLADRKIRRKNRIKAGMMGAAGAVAMGGMALNMAGVQGVVPDMMTAGGALGSMGAMAGPWGAAIGTAIGAAIPLITNYLDKIKKAQQASVNAFQASATAAEFYNIKLNDLSNITITGLGNNLDKARTKVAQLTEQFKQLPDGAEKAFIESLRTMDSTQLVQTMKNKYAALIQQGFKPNQARQTVAAQLMAADRGIMASSVLNSVGDITKRETALKANQDLQAIFNTPKSSNTIIPSTGAYGAPTMQVRNQTSGPDYNKAAGILQNTIGMSVKQFRAVDFKGFGGDFDSLTRSLDNLGEEGKSTSKAFMDVKKQLEDAGITSFDTADAAKILNAELNGLEINWNLLKKSGNIDLAINIAIKEQKATEWVSKMAKRAKGAMNEYISNASKGNDQATQNAQEAADKQIKAMEDAAAKREKLMQKQIDDTQKQYDKEIDAVQKANDAKQKAFDKEQERINRSKEMRSMEIDYMRAMAEGRFYDAASIQNDMQSTQAQYAIEDQKAKSDAKAQKKVDDLTKERDKVIGKMTKRLEKQREIDQKAIESAREAEQKKVDAVQKANEKIALDTEKMTKRLQKAYEKGPKAFRAVAKEYGLRTKEAMAAIVDYAGITGTKAKKMVAKGLTGGDWSTVSKAIELKLEGKDKQAQQYIDRFLSTTVTPATTADRQNSSTYDENRRLGWHDRNQPVSKNASGGYISGPGTATSDSIPARLSNGEYVVRARAVQRIGVSNLHKINKGEIPQFAAGGLVGDIAGGVNRSVMWSYIQQKIDARVKRLKEQAAKAKTKGGMVDAAGFSLDGVPTGPWGMPSNVSEWGTYAGHGFARDYKTPMGTPVYSVGPGKVAGSNDGVHDNTPGVNPGPNSPSNWVLVWHRKNGKRYSTYYQHLKKGSVKVSPGDVVDHSTMLAKSGNSGNSTGPHLHFEVREGWNPRYTGPWSEQIQKIWKLAMGGLIGQEGNKKPDGGGFSLPSGMVTGLTGTQTKELIRQYARYKSIEAAKKAIDTTDSKTVGKSVSDGIVSSMKNKSPGAAQRFAKEYMMKKYGWGEKHFAALKQLWDRESGWSWSAYNRSSGATGIPQSLPGSKMAAFGKDWKTNPETQIKWGLNYIKDRYGTPSGAWNFWQGHNWYKDGGLVIPQLRKGATIAYDNTLANLHKGETVLTAPLTNKLKEGVGVASNGDIVYNVDIRIDKASATAKQIDDAVYSAMDRHSAKVGRRRRV